MRVRVSTILRAWGVGFAAVLVACGQTLDLGGAGIGAGGPAGTTEAGGPKGGPPAGNATVRQLALGDSHTCALLISGGVSCWGLNAFGELGDGTTTSHATPVPVVGLPESIATLAAGGSTTCALSTAGAVFCWGSNFFGTIGDGTTVHRSVPTPVSGLSAGVLSIAVGDAHACAVLADHHVRCWGSNLDGQLGYGTARGDTNATEADAFHTVPVDVVDLADVTTLSAGWDHTNALRTNGSAVIWGGRKPAFDSSGASLTRPIPIAESLGPLKEIHAGRAHTCAIAGAGGVHCWEAFNGILPGIGTPRRKETLPSTLSTIGSGSDFVCALTSDGEVGCWGSNAGGQLGDGATTGRDWYQAVAGLPAPASALGLGATAQHACVALASGGVACWGLNDGGQLGAPSTSACRFDENSSSPAYPCSLVPLIVAGL